MTATKGKAARRGLTHQQANDWVKLHESDSTKDAARGLILLVDAAIEADRSQQAAIHEECHARIATIAGEAFGPFPVQSAEENLTAIERGIFEARRAHEEALREARERMWEALGTLEAAFGFVSSVWARLELDSSAELSAHAMKVRIVKTRNRVSAALGASQQTGTPPADVGPWLRHLRPTGSGEPVDEPPAGSGTAETCGTCGGTKVWQFDYPDNRPSEVRPCPDCGGSGTTKGGTR